VHDVTTQSQHTSSEPQPRRVAPPQTIATTTTATTSNATRRNNDAQRRASLAGVLSFDDYETFPSRIVNHTTSITSQNPFTTNSPLPLDTPCKLAWFFFCRFFYFIFITIDVPQNNKRISNQKRLNNRNVTSKQQQISHDNDNDNNKKNVVQPKTPPFNRNNWTPSASPTQTSVQQQPQLRNTPISNGKPSNLNTFFENTLNLLFCQ
jgi:hypothetical protein